jgi:Holliday junction resolvasome RuvABC DNA-binding subunit
MISFLLGKILLKNEKDVTILIGQIGYKVFLNPMFLASRE